MKPPHRSALPSEAWIEAFAAQCTEALWEAARKYAARRAAAVRRVNSATDVYYERELVQDAIGDTAMQIVHWNPSVRSLKEHVFAVIRTRSYHDYQHANRFRREPFDASDGDAAPELVAEVEAALLDRSPGADPALAARVAERMAELRSLAASDHVVMAVLDAADDGACDKADVMHHAQISDPAYHAAKERLTRIVKKVSPDTSPRRARRKKGA
jgi:hypothetical protein